MNTILMNLKYITFFILLLSTSYSISKTHPANTPVTKPIIGTSPFVNSIGVMTKTRTDILNEDFTPTFTEGTIIYIPTTECNVSGNQSRFFQIKDADDDLCLIESNDLTWFILDSTAKSWEQVTSWDDLEQIKIDETHFPNAILPPNENSRLPRLKVPKEATGKRIGFSYQPRTTTGNPSTGEPIYVWDLNFFFKQISIESPESNNISNPGIPSEINPEISGGLVIPAIEIPEIDNLYLTGRFGINEQLEVKYDFIPNNINMYEDISRFWWGNLGSTENQATIDNENWSNSSISPELNESNIGNIYEVTILPIKKENNLISIGKPAHIDTSNENNTLIFPPKITNEKIFYSATQSYQPPIYIAKKDDVISIHYDFESEQNNVADNSIYIWKNKNTQEERLTGSISEDTPNLEYVIDSDDIGSTLTVNIEPKDSTGLTGLSTTLNIPEILQYPSIIEPKFDSTPSFTKHVQASYQFNNQGQDEILDHSMYRWFYIDENEEEIELASGNITSSGTIPELEQPSITLRGKTLGFELTPNDQFDRTGETVRHQIELADIENITIFNGENINLSDLIPIKLESFAHFSNGDVIEISELGKWSSNNPKISIIDGRTVSAEENAIDEEAQLTFEYEGIKATAKIIVVKSKLSEVIGTESEFKSIISAETYPIVRIHGSAVWDGIWDPDRDVVIGGGPGGRVGGDETYNNSYTFNFDDNIKTISSLSVYGTQYLEDGFLIRNLEWTVEEDGIIKELYFRGNKVIGTLETRTKSIDIESSVYGWIVYASGPIGEKGTYIQGLQIVYY